MSDIVYFCRDGQNEELRYSLRSVERNFPHDRVIIYGGKPDDITPDIFEPIDQHEKTRWHNVRAMIEACCKNDNISEDFWLFNDDFFVMQKIDELRPQYNGTLWQHIKEIEVRVGLTNYTNQLRSLCHTITAWQFENELLNYAVHMPMLINRKKALETLAKFPDEPMFRALYGNHHHIGGENTPDCKFGTILEPKTMATRFLSTSDEAFIGADVGEYIRARFTEPSRWENGREL